VRTLHRRPLAASFWLVQFLVGWYLVNDAHNILPEWTVQEYALGMRAFYLGWILLWISPVLGWLTYLGADMGKGEWKTMIVGSAWLCIVDTYVFLSTS
jgi:15-cis-phytoene synthase/lycopene beta-cyclase